MLKRSSLIQIVLLLALLLGACRGKTAQPVAMTVGWLGFPDTLNPAYAFLSESYSMFDLVYSTLTTEAPTGEYVGVLAEDWTSTSDGLIWTFNLRDGIKWQNGEDFTADQLAWTINQVIQYPDNWAPLSSYVIGFVEARALDAQTLEIQLDAPVSNMDYRVSFIYAVYPKDFEQYKTAEELQNFANFSPIGTGPFKITTLDKDQRIIVLEANKDYFNGAAKIDQIIYQTFDNSDAMVQALKVGEIDMTTEVPDTSFEAVKGFENVKTISSPGRSLTELIINSALDDEDTDPIRNPALEDPAVRLAIETAIDKQDLVDVVRQGNGKPGVSIIPPTLGGGYWFNLDIKPVAFSLDEANRILEEAGYIMSADGVRAKGDIRLELRLQFPSDEANYPRTADMIADWLKQVGILATPEAVDPDSLVAITNPQADYDLVIWGWGSDPDPDFMLSVMTTDQFVDGGWSDSGYSNPEYDQLYLDQQVALDKGERQRIVWKMQELVYNDRPYIVLTYGATLAAYRTDRFTNFLESPLGIDSVFSFMQVEAVK